MTDTKWRIRGGRTEPRYRVTEGAALALARTMSRRFHCPFIVDERQAVGQAWRRRHEIQPEAVES